MKVNKGWGLSRAEERLTFSGFRKPCAELLHSDVTSLFAPGMIPVIPTVDTPGCPEHSLSLHSSSGSFFSLLQGSIFTMYGGQRWIPCVYLCVCVCVIYCRMYVDSQLEHVFLLLAPF